MSLYDLYELTSAICPLSEEQIVLSISALKFHLRIDIKEISPNTSRFGKDLFKDDAKFFISSTKLHQTLYVIWVIIFVTTSERERKRK